MKAAVLSFKSFLESTGYRIESNKESEFRLIDFSLSFFYLFPFENTESYQSSAVVNPTVYIYHDQWLHKPHIIKSRILSLLQKLPKIHGRKTKIHRIDQKQALDFLNINHLQGAVKSKFRYGLFYNSELVAVACFASGRNVPSKGENYRSYELIRYATKTGLTITGGLDKLLKAFIKDQNPSDIMTYVDKAWGRGNAFLNLGFETIGEIPPTINYLDENLARYSKSEAKGKHNLKEIYNLGSWKLLKVI